MVPSQYEYLTPPTSNRQSDLSLFDVDICRDVWDDLVAKHHILRPSRLSGCKFEVVINEEAAQYAFQNRDSKEPSRASIPPHAKVQARRAGIHVIRSNFVLLVEPETVKYIRILYILAVHGNGPGCHAYMRSFR